MAVSLTLCSLAVAALVTIFDQYLKPRGLRWQWFGTKWRLPPGPRPLPVVGNIFQLFSARASGQFAKFLTEMCAYGDMTTLQMGSKAWILLNSDRVAGEIIMKRGKITNERPHMPIASDLVSNGKRTVLRQTQEWREGRRVMHQLLSGYNLKVYAGMQELESRALLRSYLDDPSHWSAHHYHYSTAVLYRVVMGYPLDKTQAELDDYQRVGMEFMYSLNRSLVDFFPVLSKLPRALQPWRKFWSRMGAFHRRVFQEWWEPVRSAVVAGTAPPSFVRDVLLHPDMRYTGDDEEAMYLATSVMAAGGDNTRMTLNTFIMALIANPASLERARAELDGLCGHAQRLPTLADMSQLPYTSAMIKEVLRWRPTVPVVPPHELTEDLEIDGFHFPAGTCFLINSMAVSAEFDDADEFQPERWMIGNQDNPIADFWGFGGGRRICVGYKVAQQALFIAYSRIMYCFDVAPSGPFNSRQLNHQALGEPFPVSIKIRSPEHEALIRKS